MERARGSVPALPGGAEGRAADRLGRLLAATTARATGARSAHAPPAPRMDTAKAVKGELAR